MTIVRQYVAAALLAAIAVSVGCTPSGQVKVYPVNGRVNFEGKPMVGGGGISFVPKTGQVGKAPGGIIKPDGTYVLGTYGEADGSMVGEFRVVIFQETVKEGAAAPDGAAPTATSSAAVAPTDRIPLVYASDRDSPLTATVEAKDNEINFDLKRQ
jgi:hypothetical protein